MTAQEKRIQRLLDKTPQHVKEYNSFMVDLIDLIEDRLEQLGWSRKNLSEHLDKRPSEITKWLSGNHNLTLASLFKLQGALGIPLVSTELENYRKSQQTVSRSIKVYAPNKPVREIEFTKVSSATVAEKSVYKNAN
jgi:ribosome-binding protein aMBF1 (putative translation factor)